MRIIRSIAALRRPMTSVVGCFVAVFLTLALAVMFSAASSASSTVHLGDSRISRMLVPQVVRNIEAGFKGLGLDVVSHTIPYKRSLMMAAAGDLDGVYIHLEGAVSRYPTLIRVDVPVYRSKAWAWVLNERECPEAISDLKSLTTISVLGFPSYQQLEAIAESPTIQVADVLSALRVLKSQRADYLMASDVAIGSAPLELRGAYKKCFDEPLVSLRYYTFLNRRNAPWVPKLEALYRQMFLGDGR